MAFFNSFTCIQGIMRIGFYFYVVKVFPSWAVHILKLIFRQLGFYCRFLLVVFHF